MVIFFPKKELSHHFTNPFKIERVTINYLNEQLKELTGKGIDTPSDSKIITPAEKQRIYNNMLSILSTEPNNSKTWKAHWLAYQILRWIIFSYQPDNQNRKQAKEKLTLVIAQLLKGPLNISQQKQLAADALSISKPNLAFKIYNKILIKNPTQTATTFAKIAIIANQSNHYLSAGDLYLKAYKAEKSIDKKKQYIIESITSYQAGAHHKQVIISLKMAGAIFNQDPEALLFMSKAALGANDPKLAKEYVQKLLQLEKK